MIYELVFSATGRTQGALDIVSNVWQGEKTQIDLSARDLDAGKYVFTADDVALLAVSVYGGRIPKPATENLRKLTGNGAKAVLLAVFGNRAIDNCLMEMRVVMEQQGFVPIAGMEISVQHSLLPAFAADRPDAEDVAELQSFARQVQEKLASNTEFTALEVPGEYPEGEIGPASMIPKGNEACVNCGLCAEKCPTGAIPMDEPASTDATKCICCMRCATVCPVGARDLPSAMIAAMTEKVAPIFSSRKPNKLYL